MSHPKVTVLMPVFNAEIYLDEAIESILAQSFLDFEFLIINDGSTDGSKERILSHCDKRIRYLENPENLKIAKTLNRGIRLAKGQYIARMDADDVSKQHRLQELVHHLDQNPVVDAVFSTIVLIESKGREFGVWELDRKVLLQEDIRLVLPRENCLAHPTAMFRRNVLERYMYDEQSLMK